MQQENQTNTKKQGTQKQTGNEVQQLLEECKKEREEYLKGWQRQKADFLNYKKQEQERIESLIASIQRDCLLGVVEIYDDFERALKNIPQELDNNEWARGVVEIKKRFEQFLKQEGVEEIKAKGEQFDPRFHEAIEQVKAKERKKGEIVEVLHKGYLIKGRLLRPAKVKVTM